MKNIISFLILYLSYTTNLLSQNIVKVGDQAPEIVITNYILDSPKNKNLENKFIVLEFWATWCAPCLGAVPHLNELKNKYKERDDLLFISLTYEKPEKVKKTLEKIKFNTIVVSDQTKKTELNYNVGAIPHTVLINNKGIVKWIGKPNSLNDTLIDILLNGEEIVTEIKSLHSTKNNDGLNMKKPEKKRDIALENFNDDKNLYFFCLSNAEIDEKKFSIQNLRKGKYIEYNMTFESIISKINKKSPRQIIVPDTLKNKKFNILYKNLNKLELEDLNNDLKSNVLSALNLTENLETKTVEVYLLRILDSTKLNYSNENEDEMHSGENETHLIYSNSSIESLIQGIEDSKNEIIINETKLNKKFDFIIRKSSLDFIIKDLNTYGLKLEKVKRQINFLSYR